MNRKGLMSKLEVTTDLVCILSFFTVCRPQAKGTGHIRGKTVGDVTFLERENFSKPRQTLFRSHEISVSHYLAY